MEQMRESGWAKMFTWGVTHPIVVAVLVLFLAPLLYFVPKSVVWLDASHVMVIQHLDGTLSAHFEPGPKWQGGGAITKYPRQSFYEFDNEKATCKAQKDMKGNPPIRVRFAEGGHGSICGTLRWEMPATPKQLFEIQKDFGSAYAVENTLVSQSLVNAIFLSGQTMTSTESAAERRADLLHYIEDQMRGGVYKTTTKQTRVVDQVTKQERTITLVEIVKDETGKPLRNNVSAIGEYGVKLVQTAISEIPYEKSVEDQIIAQQKARADVQVAIANATAAEQQTRTVAEQGKAAAMKSQWVQEEIKAREVTKAKQEKEVAETNATQRREVARLDKEAAEFTKQKEILLGQGESEKRRLILAADGALAIKLEAYVKTQETWAKALGGHAGGLVPTIVMGQDAAKGQSTAMSFMEILTAKAARDLELDMKVKK